MNRTLMQIRSIFFRSGVKRADWLRKRKYFGMIGKDVMIQDYKLPYNPDKVFIGNNVRLASDVSLITHDVSYHVLNNYYGTNSFEEKTGQIVIGDNVFIGSKTIILYDVKIGNNVIVGAGSIVTRDLPSGSVCAGIPCRKIGEFESFCNKRKAIKAQGA